MALNPANTATVSGKDRSGESWSYSMNTEEAKWAEGAGNAEYIALVTATAALIDGVVTRRSFTETFRASNAKFSAAGQREQKFLVTYEDLVTLVPYNIELPCRKVTLDPPVNTDEYDITAVPFAAYVTALEAYITSPDGNPVNVTSIRLMGKNT